MPPQLKDKFLMTRKRVTCFLPLPMPRVVLAYERCVINTCRVESNIATWIINDTLDRKYQVSTLV